MKILKRLFILILLLGAIGYGAYYFGMDFVSEKAASAVTEKLDDEASYSEIKESVQSIPEVKEFVESGANADKEALPFTTKEEATKLVIKKVGVTELKQLYDRYQDGMTEEDIPDVINMLEGKLSEDEMLALKALAYQELNP